MHVTAIAEVTGLHQYRELRQQGFSLLLVEAQPGMYRLYVGQDGQRYCHYDTGKHENLDTAAEAAGTWFDPGPFLLFPWTPYSREEVLGRASDALDEIANHNQRPLR
jgi:hypothetical protein